MWDDSLSSAGGFLEGAWESVSTGAQNALGGWASGAQNALGDWASGAQNALGDWASGAQNAIGDWVSGEDKTSSPAANVNRGKDANATTNTTATGAQAPVLFGLDQKTLMIGAGVLLAALLLIRK